MNGVAGAFPQRRWRAWALAARGPTLTAAVTPVLVGTAAAASNVGAATTAAAIAVGATGGQFHPLPFATALVGAVCIQIGTNFANDAFDFLRGADTSRRRGPTRAAQSGLLTPRQVLAGAYACFGLASLAGLYLVALRGWPLLVAGLLSIGAGLAYTGGPWPFGYHGLGELFVFLFFGVLAVTGSAYAQTGSLNALALAASMPVGLLVTAILVVNNLRDIETDRAAGKRTLAVLMGARATRALYVLLLTGAAVAPAALRLAGLTGAWFWLPWLTAPLLVSLAGAVLWRPDAPTLNRALRQTARVHLLYGALFAASLLW